MSQQSLGLDSNKQLRWIELQRGLLGWQADYVAGATELYEQLVAELDWLQPRVRVYGKEHPVPRKLAFFGDPGIAYGYSGLRHQACPWPASLQSLRDQLQDDLQQCFNCVLVNWYRDGRDSMGFHSDDEAELGPNPCIASISLGATRRFVLRPRRGLRAEQRDIQLTDGSLLVMAAETQHYWQHGLPRQLACEHGRINLTFRKVQVSNA